MSKVTIFLTGACIWCDEKVEDTRPYFDEETEMMNIYGQVCEECEELNYKYKHGEQPETH